MTSIHNYTYKNQNLDYLEIINGDGLPTIVLFHGYGANMRDLAPLASISPELKKFNWIFPDGPLKVLIGPNTYGKSWFPIDMQEMNHAMINGGFDNLFSVQYPKGMQQSTELLLNFLTDKVDGELIIGGFSQGSMMSCDLAFNTILSPKSLILLSSTLVAQKVLEKSLIEQSVDFPIFQSHGTQDSVLPIHMAKKLREILIENKLNVDYQEFPGGHEIPPRVLQSLIQFLKVN